MCVESVRVDFIMHRYWHFVRVKLTKIQMIIDMNGHIRTTKWFTQFQKHISTWLYEISHVKFMLRMQ